MKILSTFSFILLLTLQLTTKAQVYWGIDRGHGHVEFSLTYMMLGEYEGRFRSYDGKIVSKTETDFTDATFDLMIEVKSVSAEVEGHEGMLTGKGFFDAEKYPLITFRSTATKPGKTPGTYTLEGDLTMKGVTKKVSLLAVTAPKPVKNYYFGETDHAIKVTGKVLRSDFGIGPYEIMEDGGVVLSDEVNIACTIQLVKMDSKVPNVRNDIIKVDEKKLEAYVGIYEAAPGATLQITKEEAHLMAEGTNKIKREIFPISENKFIYEFQNIQLEFVKDNNGAVTKVLQVRGGKTIEAIKTNKPIKKEVTAEQPKDTIINYNALGWEAILDKKYAEAVTVLEKGLKANPSDTGLYCNLGHAHLFAGNYAKAMECYKKYLGKGGYIKEKMIQEDFTVFKAKKFPAAEMDKAFKELNMIPNVAYRGMKG